MSLNVPVPILDVPVPILEQEGASGNFFSGEKPITLSCGPVTFVPEKKTDDEPDLELEPANALAFGFLLYRDVDGVIEVWNEQDKKWLLKQDGQLGPEPQSLFPKNQSWQSILIAIGQKDHDGIAKLETDTLTHWPKYFVRCFFRGKDANGVEHSGTSPESRYVEIAKFGNSDRAGLATKPPESPSAATQIGLFLRDSALVTRGEILIRQETGGGVVIELIANGGSMALTSSGGILLTPASGQVVQVVGQIQVNGTTLTVP